MAIHFLKQKSEVQDLFKNFVRRVKTETRNVVTCLRTDNGGEYTSTEFENWLLKKGIAHEKSVPYTPEQNGVAERSNRTILDSARSMLHSADLNVELWAEACNCAFHILNQLATKTVENKTPYEIWKGVKPNLSHLRVFFSAIYVHIQK